MVYKWTLGELKGISIDDLWTWVKSDGLACDRDTYMVLDKYADFKKELWLELVNSMWRKHRSVFQDHLNYIFTEIVNPLCVIIIRYAKHVKEIHELEKHLPPPSIKGDGYEVYNWKFCDKEFSVHDIRVHIKD